MSDEADLEATLRLIEPGWRFVKERSLAQAHRLLRDHGERIPPSLRLPLVLTTIDAEACGCFPPSIIAEAQAQLVLVTFPNDRGLRFQSRSQQLAHYWRVLYALRLPTVNAQQVWRPIPPVLQREAEAVLTASGLVPDDASQAELARAFAVDLLTTARFAPETLEYRYPGFEDWPGWRARFVDASDEETIFNSTRPDGVVEPPPSSLPSAPTPASTVVSDRDATRAGNLAQRAEAAEAQGNLARSAILFAAASAACSTGSTKYRNEAKNAIRKGLVDRLAVILQWDPHRTIEWNQALKVLLAPAADGHWSPAAKALYELQKVAVDLEGDLYAVDPVGWVTSFGRKPILRKLSLARLAWLHQRLQKIKKQIAYARLAPTEFEALQTLVDTELHRAELALRGAMEPIVHRVFHDVGLVPSNIIERIALPKIVDEMLDTTVAKGFLRFGDLRDILSRNQLKMPDLAGPVQLLRGDPLLQADRRLGEQLDGVYTPAEIYLRWFQRVSAVAFGTKIGRWFTLFLALPFGASFMTVEFAKYIALEIGTVTKYVAGLFGAAEPADEHGPKSHGITMSSESMAVMLGLGFVYLGLIHSTVLRKFAGRLLGTIASSVHWIFAVLPSRIWNSTAMRAFRRNRLVRWFHRRLAVPAVAAGVTALAGIALDWPDEVMGYAVAGTFLLLAIVVNTPPGMVLQSRLEAGLAWLWRQIRVNFFPGLLGWVVWIFRGLLSGLDRLIYSIDEWFRFREGQAKPSLAIKVGLGLIWFPVRYVLRFAIYLLIEPQINPLKHFPVVTVSHKLLLPMIPAISTATGVAKEWVTGILTGVPGIFGFLAWELRENWRLYSANRPHRVSPLAVGRHGETVRGLLRPGFHSGTVPKAFSSIRRALAKAEEADAPAQLHKPLETLHHVEEAIRHFVERDFLAYLGTTRAWAGVNLHCDVHLGLQQIRVEVSGDAVHAVLDLELIESDIVGRCDDAAFLAGASAEQVECWRRAVLGFNAMGAVPSDDPRLNWQEWVRFWEASGGTTPSDRVPCTSSVPSAPSP